LLKAKAAAGSFSERIDPDVRRRRGKIILRQQGADLRGSAAKVPRELHLLITGCGNLGQGAGHVRLHQVANGV
jgi:hypothetical protein